MFERAVVNETSVFEPLKFYFKRKNCSFTVMRPKDVVRVATSVGFGKSELSFTICSDECVLISGILKVNLLRIPGPNVKFTDVVEATRTEVASLKAAGAKIIIALTHIGYKADKLVAEAVDGIDVIVGGHSHSFLYTGKMPCFSVVGAHLSLRTPN